MHTPDAPALDKRNERIQRMFAGIAPWYDFLNHFLSLNIDRAWRSRTAKLAPPHGEGPVLDLCTGTGDLAFAYDRAVGGTRAITGADFCPQMLDIARQKAEKRGAAGRVQFLRADAQDLPFPADHFRLVSCAFGLRNIADTDRGLAEMARVAAPGGSVAVLEFSKPRNRVLGGIYLFYFRHVLPRLAKIFCRGEDGAYRYLPDSVLAFPDGEALADRMRRAGLTDVTYRPFTLGVATLYVGRKP